MRLLLLLLVVAAASAACAVATAPSSATSGAVPTVVARSSAYGKILFDGRTRALYAFTRDRRGGASTCFRACARAWPPFLVRGPLSAGPGARRALLGTIRRRDGTRQVTYRGRPLYYYVGDGRGEVRCQNVDEFGGVWLVVRGDGTLVR
jgi:predicted lipoprotein with Yx(FWY)xxD motif